MADESPYTKRELDEWRNTMTKDNELIKDSLEKINESIFQKGELYAKTVQELAKITSHNSGQILALWEAQKKDQKATNLINDIASFGTVTKWIFYIIVSLGAVYSAVKLLASSWLINIFKL